MSKWCSSRPVRGTLSLLWLGCLAGLLAGCTATEIPVYTPRQETTALPEKHRREIASYLEKYFGTPLRPLLRITATNEEDSADSADAFRLIDHVSPNVMLHGREVYRAQCQGCHGITGDGAGEAAPYLDPLPRDYRNGIFKFASTPRGRKPRTEDLERIIKYGAKGTSMPAFRWMPAEDVAAVIAYVKSLSMRGELELALIRESEDELEETDSYDPATVAEYASALHEAWLEAPQHIVLAATPKVPYTPENIELGARAFVKESCYKCHGIDGRGNPQNKLGKDAWGNDAYAANLAAGVLHGGRRPIDIYRRIHAGINGTPMPAYGSTLEAQGRIETVWHLVHFITSIVEGRALPQELLSELEREAEAAVKQELEGASPPASAEPASATPDPTTEN
jgi:mono/diheme cytochrome c family protein